MNNNALSLLSRIQMERQRRNVNHHLRCDMCNAAPGTERHHIVNKHSTQGNESARSAAEHPALSAWLCRGCHGVADTREAESSLIQFNARLWGKGVVEDAMANVNAHLVYPIIVILEETLYG